MNILRLISKRRVPRYKRRKFARAIVTMLPGPKFLCMVFANGVLAGGLLCLLVVRH